MKKSIQTLALALAVSAALAACGSTGKTPDAGVSGETAALESASPQGETAAPEESTGSDTEEEGSTGSDTASAGKESTGSGTAPDAENKETALAGTYTFTEEINAAGNAFEQEWDLVLSDDGSYALKSRAMMGDIDLAGTYTQTDETTVVCGAPKSGDTERILASWFNEDYSCAWTVDPAAGTAVPVKYGDSAIEAQTQQKTFADTWTGTKYLDVPYASVSPSETLDILLPDGAGADTPVVVMIHGGAFMFGDKQMEQVSKCFEALLERGYAVATINYRLSGEAIYPAAVGDAKAAVRFLRANAGEYGLSKSRIFVWGESAGAYLANMAAETSWVEELDADVTDNSDEDSSVAGLVSFFAPVDWYHMDEDFKALGVTEDERPMGLTSTDTSGESRFFGRNVGEDEEETEKTNPINYISGMPQETFYAFIEHGNEDVNVPYLQSERLYEALAEKYGTDTITYTLLEGQAHEGDGFYTKENLQKVIDFLDSIPEE